MRPRLFQCGLLAALLLCLWAVSVYAQPKAFVVQDIAVQGLARVQRATFMHYLPIKVGQRLTPQKTETIIRALYQTGFFSDIQLLRQGPTLRIVVQERPMIGHVDVVGNETLPKAQLDALLQSVHLEPGALLRLSQVHQIKNTLEDQYRSHSHYAATITAVVTPGSGNRSDLRFHIHEGPVAKIQSIHLHGNHRFCEKTLRKHMGMTTWRLWSFFTESDQYSEEKAQSDAEQLRAFYMDHGYLNVQIAKPRIHFDAEKKRVDMDFEIEEGQVYTIDRTTVTGNFLGDKAALARYVTLKKGDIFSRQVLLDNKKQMMQYLANQGFAMASVSVIPEVHQKQHGVSMVFHVDAGKKMSVKRIHFVGNTRTGDTVLRREMRQMEGQLFSQAQIEESKRRLANLGYLEGITVDALPLSADQLALTFSVKESRSSSASLQMGYSDIDGLLYGAHLNQNNFLGTGRSVSLAFDRSAYAKDVQLRYTNPYYTLSGISRSMDLYQQKTTPGKTNISAYEANNYGGKVTYHIPWRGYTDWVFSYGYEHIQLVTGEQTPHEIEDFIREHGDHFDQFKTQWGFSYRHLDQRIFPNRGLTQQFILELGLPLTGESLDYYTLFHTLDWYQPMHEAWIFKLHTQLGYGGGYGRTGSDLPFFKHFYAGGIGSVRGYVGNSIGPVDSMGRAQGGNVMAVANMDVILPPWFDPKIRTSLFFDVGGVGHDRLGGLRCAAGISIQWRSPIAPLVFSLGKAFNARNHNAEVFQFSIGTG